ncbi:MAG: hypothetical protein WCN85_03940, partial [Burkholderiales bacterium]
MTDAIAKFSHQITAGIASLELLQPVRSILSRQMLCDPRDDGLRIIALKALGHCQGDAFEKVLPETILQCSQCQHPFVT